MTSIIRKDILKEFEGGQFRFVIKTNLGYTCQDAREFENKRLFEQPELLLTRYKKGVLQSIQFKPNEGSDYWLTVFTRVGKKVKLIDNSILETLTVGTINQLYYNTNLYDMTQYKRVNAKSWADKAYVMN